MLPISFSFFAGSDIYDISCGCAHFRFGITGERAAERQEVGDASRSRHTRELHRGQGGEAYPSCSTLHAEPSSRETQDSKVIRMLEGDGLAERWEEWGEGGNVPEIF